MLIVMGKDRSPAPGSLFLSFFRSGYGRGLDLREPPLSLSLSPPCHPEGPAIWGSSVCCVMISILLYSVSARTMRGPSADCISAGGRQRLATADDQARHHPRLSASHGSFFKTGPLTRHASERGPCDANGATDSNLMAALNYTGLNWSPTRFEWILINWSPIRFQWNLQGFI